MEHWIICILKTLELKFPSSPSSGGWGRFLRRLRSFLTRSLRKVRNELGTVWNVLRTGLRFNGGTPYTDGLNGYPSIHQGSTVGQAAGELGTCGYLFLRSTYFFKIPEAPSSGQAVVSSTHSLKPVLNPVLSPNLKPVLKPILKPILKPVLKLVLKPVLNPL